jgi:hypothetical protein
MCIVLNIVSLNPLLSKCISLLEMLPYSSLESFSSFGAIYNFVCFNLA